MALPDRRCPLAAGQLALLVSLSSLFLSTPESPRPRWQLVWHDEFDNPGLDAGKWGVAIRILMHCNPGVYAGT